jgi:hypothetical protein
MLLIAVRLGSAATHQFFLLSVAGMVIHSIIGASLYLHNFTFKWIDPLSLSFLSCKPVQSSRVLHAGILHSTEPGQASVMALGSFSGLRSNVAIAGIMLTWVWAIWMSIFHEIMNQMAMDQYLYIPFLGG